MKRKRPNRIFLYLFAGILCVALCACGKNSTSATDENNDKLIDSMNIEKVEDYLYTVTLEDYDYDYALERFEYLFKADGGCAAIRNGDFRGRNYDWTYDDQAYFVIYTPAKENRHAVLGVAGSISSLTADVVDSGEWSDGYKSLAFATLDGVNDAGLVCNILVVPSGEAGLTFGSNPEAEDLPAAMVNRYVLDYAGSVEEAIELLKNRNIYMPHTDVMDQEFHWMISDRDRTVIIEFVDNEMKVLEDEKIATNFYLYNFDKSEETLPRIPEGIERYHIIKDGYESTATEEGMMKMLQSINYSQCYDLNTVPFWYSEYSGGELDASKFGDPDISDSDLSRAGGYSEAISNGLENWSKGRNNNTWITVYSAVYDMNNRTLSIATQENTDIHKYSLDDFMGE